MLMNCELPVSADDLYVRKLFRDIPSNIINSLLAAGGVKFLSLESRAPLKLRRDNTEFIYIIVSGYLEVRMDSHLIKKGNSFLIAFRGPEQVVGEMQAISKESHEASISACGSCELIEIPTEALTRVAEIDWRIYRNLAGILIEKTFQERKRIEVIQMPEGKAQVAQALLIFLSERGSESGDGKGQKINGVLRQSDIADYIGCDRTTVAKRLRDLKRRKIIAYPNSGRNSDPRITICDNALLEKIAKNSYV